MKDTDLISQMLIDTLDSTDINKRTFLYEVPDNLVEIDAYLDKERSCYCLMISGVYVEAPINWAPFKNRLKGEFVITNTEDDFKLLSVFNMISNSPVSALKIILHKESHLPLKKSA
jgi:hypothetical protein